MKGKLYLIPTTLGDFETIASTMPAYNLEIIHGISDFIVENIRTARRFISKTNHPVAIDEMNFFEIGKHAVVELLGEFLGPLEWGRDMGLMSEAGTPCIADPGSLIVNMAHERKLDIVPLVGPNSVILALMASGFNGQNFVFHGYLPVAKNALKRKIKEIENQVYKNDQTQIFIETPFRNEKLLNALITNCNPVSRLCVAVNLTLSGQRVISLPVSNWKYTRLDILKKPAVFLLYK